MRAGSIVLAACCLAACGDASVDDVNAGNAIRSLDTATVAQLLPPEARGIVTSYERDLKGAAAAYLAQYGQLPDSFAQLTSIAGARETAVSAIADGLGQQVPFASRATLEQAAAGLVGAAERRVLDGMKAQNAPN